MSFCTLQYIAYDVNAFSVFCVFLVIPTSDVTSLSDQILYAVLQLLKKEVPEHGRHLAQYFHLFLTYSNLGLPEVSASSTLPYPKLILLNLSYPIVVNC